MLREVKMIEFLFGIIIGIGIGIGIGIIFSWRVLNDC